MDNETWERFSEVMYEKYATQMDWYPTREEGLRNIIGGVVADTSLLLDGSISLKQWLQKEEVR